MYHLVPMINQNLIQEFGLRIKQLRAQKKLSQEELSYETGFHRTYIGMIERGERNISLSHIAVFAKAFGLNVSELLDFTEINPSHTFKSYQTKITE